MRMRRKKKRVAVRVSEEMRIYKEKGVFGVGLLNASFLFN